MNFLVVTAFLIINRVDRVVGVSASTVTIDSDTVTLRWERWGINTDLKGFVKDRTFTYRDKEWSYQVAVFHLNSTFEGIFTFDSNVIVRGKRALMFNVSGNVVLNTTINASAVAVGTSSGHFHLGGFSLTSTNCCYVGAGPGAGFTFHGGGHGGVGGGSWIDGSTNVSYGKNYQMSGLLVGGSSGAFMYDSNPGSGGGAVAFHATGVLTVGSNGRILANGYNVKDTSFPACAGGSAGGRIHLSAAIAVIEGELSVMGGNSGISSNYSDYCGDGGGGGVILIRAFDIRFSNLSTVHYNGGRGLENGSIGLFDSMSIITGIVEIETTKCEMTFFDNHHKKHGVLTSNPVTIDCDQWNLTVCTFTFDNTVKFNSTANVLVKGKHALKIVVKFGDILVETKIIMNEESVSYKALGGYNNGGSNNPGPGSKANSAAHGNINDPRSYGIWPLLLLGGSSCTNGSLAVSTGGGALALEAKNGKIVVDANISADARSHSQSSKCGASGGVIILDAKHVIINAFVTANGCDGEIEGGAGGIVKTTNGSNRILIRAGTGQSLNNSNAGIVLEGPDYRPAVNPPSRSCRILSSSAPSIESTNVWSTSSFVEASHTSHYETQSFMTPSATSTLGTISSEQSSGWSAHPESSHILTADVSRRTKSLADTSNSLHSQRESSIMSLASSPLDIGPSDAPTLVSSAHQLSSHILTTDVSRRTKSLADTSNSLHSQRESSIMSLASSPLDIVPSDAPTLVSSAHQLSSHILTTDVSRRTKSLADTSNSLHSQRESSIMSLASSPLDIVPSDAPTLVSSAHQLSSHIIPTASSSYQEAQSSAFHGRKNVVSKEFRKLVGVEVNSSTALNISSALANALTSSSTVTHKDTLIAMNIIGQLTNSSLYAPENVGKARTITTNVVKSCSKIAKLNFDSESESNRTMGLVPHMARNLEDLGDSISKVLKAGETFVVQDDTIAIEVTVVAKDSSIDRIVPVSNISKSNEDNVTIPKEVFASIPGNVSMTLVLINTSSTYNQSVTVDGGKIQAVSNILSVRINKEKLDALEKPIVLRSKLRKKLPKKYRIKGGFWKVKRKEDTNEGWSYAGCSSTDKGGYIETKCNHMTSFAVLLSVTEQKIPDHHKEALSLITYIGCGISLFGLLLTFAAYVTLDNLDPERATIHTNLVVSLGIAQIVFLAGINATGSKVACTTVAVLLHYFFTAAFSWMFAEGIQLYTKIVCVFSHGSRLKFYYVMGWGLPVIVVALSAGIRPDGYGTNTACWISIEAGLIWAFVAPVAIVIIINFVILILVVKILISSVSTVQVDSKTSQEMNKSMQQVKAGAKAMIILMPILGLSWIFGILAVNEATLVFQYLFCIFNSLQGFFIFIVYVIGNSEVRSAFRRLQEKHSLSKSVGERSYALRSFTKKARDDSQGEEILVRRETGSSLGSPGDERTVTSKTLSAGQISLNSLNCPMPLEDNS